MNALIPINSRSNAYRWIDLARSDGGHGDEPDNQERENSPVESSDGSVILPWLQDTESSDSENGDTPALAPSVDDDSTPRQKSSRMRIEGQLRDHEGSITPTARERAYSRSYSSHSYSVATDAIKGANTEHPSLFSGVTDRDRMPPPARRAPRADPELIRMTPSEESLYAPAGPLTGVMEEWIDGVESADPTRKIQEKARQSSGASNRSFTSGNAYSSYGQPVDTAMRRRRSCSDSTPSASDGLRLSEPTASRHAQSEGVDWRSISLPETFPSSRETARGRPRGEWHSPRPSEPTQLTNGASPFPAGPVQLNERSSPAPSGSTQVSFRSTIPGFDVDALTTRYGNPLRDGAPGERRPDPHLGGSQQDWSHKLEQETQMIDAFVRRVASGEPKRERKRRRLYMLWSREEIATLIRLWSAYGNAWAYIKDMDDRSVKPVLQHRTQVDLKDKIRNIKQYMLRYALSAEH